MILMPKGYAPLKGCKPPRNMATLDHMISRNYDVRRVKDNEKVLACARCNVLRAAIEHRHRRNMRKEGHELPKLPVSMLEQLNAEMKQLVYWNK